MDRAKRCIVFDLDGTLAISKSPMDGGMAQSLSALLANYKVAIVSGGDISQFEKQVISRLPGEANLNNLILFPTNAAKMYVFDGGCCFKLSYANLLSQDEKSKIIKAFREVCVDPTIGCTYGDTIEDRGSQITFSALGQNAPIEVKRGYDLGSSKRKGMVDRLKELLPGYKVSIGGMTSIDITGNGVGKSNVIQQMELLGFDKGSIVFIGDALFEGGNDFDVKATGVKCIEVNDVEDTKKIIERLNSG